MIDKRNIFLIGPMGSGKTAVGRHLARLFRLTFHDSDADIEARTGVDIAFIFEKEGEAGFRVRERESIDRLTQLDSIVLATGGGAVIDPANRRALSERGAVVYAEIADVTVSTDGRRVQLVAEEIHAELRRAQGRTGTAPRPV
jgi:shikimate kinase